MTSGQSVLITGASGGVGSYSVQLAVAAGAEVTAVCSLTKRDHVIALGAHHVLDYAVDDWADGTRRYDVILDIAGSPSLRRLRRALNPHGTAVFVGGEQAGSITGMGRQLRGTVLSPFIAPSLKILLARERGTDYEQLSGPLEAGELRPVLDRTYPLEQAVEAMRKLEEGAIRGKVAITSDEPAAPRFTPSPDLATGRGLRRRQDDVALGTVAPRSRRGAGHRVDQAVARRMTM